MSKDELRDKIFRIASQDGAALTDPGRSRKEFVADMEKAFGVEGKATTIEMFRNRELVSDWKGTHVTRIGYQNWESPRSTTEKMEKEKSEQSKEIRFYRAVGPYGFLSNLYSCSVEFEGFVFTCAEAAYQFGKPKDRKVAQWLISAPKPHLCAVAAHALLYFDIQPDWNRVKVDRMRKVLAAKFSNGELAEKLLATGDAQLIEASKTDSFWGVSLSGDNHRGVCVDLHLVLMYKWYDLIAAGNKTVEHRRLCKYWIDRILGAWCKQAKKDRVVVFHRGYTATTMSFVVSGVTVDVGREMINLCLGDRKL